MKAEFVVYFLMLLVSIVFTQSKITLSLQDWNFIPTEYCDEILK